MAEQKSSTQQKPSTRQKSSSDLPEPLRTAASALRKVPGSGVVTRTAEETLDRIGTVSPRGRRIAVYTGAGVLGVAGVVEWPVALTGAAVAWLTQPRPQEREEPEGAKSSAKEASGDGRGKASSTRRRTTSTSTSTAKRKSSSSGTKAPAGRGGSRSTTRRAGATG
ncbi:hypothetical protein [Streptomyces sp. NPDC002845]